MTNKRECVEHEWEHEVLPCPVRRCANGVKTPQFQAVSCRLGDGGDGVTGIVWERAWSRYTINGKDEWFELPIIDGVSYDGKTLREKAA